MKPKTKLRVVTAPAKPKREPSIAAMLATYQKREVEQRELLAKLLKAGRDKARANGEIGVINYDRICREYGRK